MHKNMKFLTENVIFLGAYQIEKPKKNKVPRLNIFFPDYANSNVS